MLTYTDLPLLPTQLVGSAGVPSWIWVFRDAIAEGKVGPEDIRETLMDAVNIAIQDATEAGVDIISDGEFFRADFTWNFHERIAGLEKIPFERRLGYPGPDQLDAFRAVEPLTVPNGYGLVDEVRYIKTRTNKPFITALQSPLTQAFRIDPGKVYKDKGEVAWALVPYINKELKDAVAAGARHIQFDEPAFWTMPGGMPEFVKMYNACVEGVNATIGVHLCFGNFRGRPATSDRTYKYIAPYLEQMNVDVVHMEFANRCMWEADLWAKYGGDKILCAGVIDVKGRSLETPELVAERIRLLLRYVKPEKLWVSSDCGFSQTARWLAVEKMKVMVKGAAIVRKELMT
ncbi:MAG: methionine synthase [Candidatus Brachytrichaceae bacterium NZ_4S206]|jgi:5-methyltetrahydropteroyltriglutamate--homocysteine methyltransferase